MTNAARNLRYKNRRVQRDVSPELFAEIEKEYLVDPFKISIHTEIAKRHGLKNWVVYRIITLIRQIHGIQAPDILEPIMSTDKSKRVVKHKKNWNMQTRSQGQREEKRTNRVIEKKSTIFNQRKRLEEAKQTP